MSEAMIKVAVVGDSISAGNPGWDPNPAFREREGDNPQSQYEYWAALHDPRLDFRNHGVGGERSPRSPSRLEEGVQGADVLVVQGGINDIVQGLPIEDAADGPARDGRPRSGARPRSRDRGRAALEQGLARRRTEDPSPERADR